MSLRPKNPMKVEAATVPEQAATPASQPLEVNLEDWASFTAGLHFRQDLIQVVRLRREARDRATERRRRDARDAVERTPTRRLTADEIVLQRDTAKLYARILKLEKTGKIRWDDHKSTWVARPIYTTRTDSTRPPSYTVEELLSRFDKVRRHGKGWTGRCPAHTDKRPSLAITEGDKGWLLKCWAGCTFTEIVHAADLESRRMFYE